jgi:hypothetical protein
VLGWFRSHDPWSREYAASPVVIDVGSFEFAWLDWEFEGIDELTDYWRSERKQYES